MSSKKFLTWMGIAFGNDDGFFDRLTWRERPFFGDGVSQLCPQSSSTMKRSEKPRHSSKILRQNTWRICPGLASISIPNPEKIVEVFMGYKWKNF